MIRPRCLDLFCGAGGSGKGLHDAGFDVVGVDGRPMPRYPFTFVQADALGYLATHWQEFDAIHAAPPCQDHSISTHDNHGTGWLLTAVLSFLRSEVNIPWIVENVPGAPLTPHYRLCGCMFGLPNLKRERWFETSWGSLNQQAMTHHHVRGETVSVFGHSTTGKTRRDREEAMGIDWMSRSELAQAIPPPYLTLIGRHMKLFVKERIES